MGYSSWNSTTYENKTATLRTQSRAEVFTQRGMNKNYDPKNITLRESRDSDANPQSTPIIIALDVTGSMGHMPEHMVKHGLGTLVDSLLETQVVSDPHMMFMAVGDVHYDKAPLQVTQFEPDTVIVDQMRELWLEGGGGGNRFESYDLPWLFAAEKTDTDAWAKRQEKGYLFTIGDELPPQVAEPSVLKEDLGLHIQGKMDAKQALALAQERYHVFHINMTEGFRGRSSVTRWREILDKRCIECSNHQHISEVITSVMQVNEGADVDEVIASWQDQRVRDTVTTALYGSNGQ